MSSRDRPAEPHSFSIGLQAKRRMKKKPGAKEQTARSKRTAQSSSARSAVPGMGKVHPTTVASGGAREAGGRIGVDCGKVEEWEQRKTRGGKRLARPSRQKKCG